MPVQYQRQPNSRLVRYAIHGVLISSLAVVAACGSDSSTSPKISGFLAGTSSNRQIGLVVNSTGKSLILFQLGNPTNTQTIAFGASSDITPVGFSTSGHRLIVPLGNTASVAYLDLDTTTVLRYFTFPSGNATGSAFVDDTTVLVANPDLNTVGRFTIGQASTSITNTVTVALQPTAVIMAGTKAMILSSNEDPSIWPPVVTGVLTAIDPTTMHVVGTAPTGGINPTVGAVGPDGLLYVLNSGDYNTNPGNLAIIDPTTLQVKDTVPMGIGPGDISIDANGIAYISSYTYGTVIWNTQTKQFVRDLNHPVCAPAVSGPCKGAASSVTDAAGNLYQVYAGSESDSARVYVYHSGTFALTDSIATGSGPVSIAIRTF